LFFIWLGRSQPKSSTTLRLRHCIWRKRTTPANCQVDGINHTEYDTCLGRKEPAAPRRLQILTGSSPEGWPPCPCRGANTSIEQKEGGPAWTLRPQPSCMGAKKLPNGRVIKKTRQKKKRRPGDWPSCAFTQLYSASCSANLSPPKHTSIMHSLLATLFFERAAQAPRA